MGPSSGNVLLCLPVLLTMMNKDDRKLIEKLYHAYKETVYRIAQKSLGTKEDTEDAVEESFMRMCLYVDDLRELPAEQALPYIAKLTVNVCRLHYVDRMETVTHEVRLSAEDGEKAPYESGYSDGLSDAMHIGALSGALDTASERDKALLTMRYIYGYGFREIAKRYGISESAARTAVWRAKERIRKNGIDKL